MQAQRLPFVRLILSGMVALTFCLDAIPAIAALSLPTQAQESEIPSELDPVSLVQREEVQANSNRNSNEEALAVLEKALQALGGLERLKRLNGKGSEFRTADLQGPDSTTLIARIEKNDPRKSHETSLNSSCWFV
ncbi:MAG: hypothetical protein ND866_08305 [Pyrinomonadaceae bacterium]|nr:hypothetical protein [Pyrinomonadaceae bacterium]